MEIENTEENSKTDNEFTPEQQEVLNSVSIPNHLNIQINNTPPVSQEVIQMNESFELARKMYQDVLSPQLKQNEDLKRTHKTLLMEKIFGILKWQFIFTYIFVLILIIGTLASSYIGLSETIVQSIIKFVEFYITSIVVELLSILFFIVKNVFDKSIVDLIRNFDKQENKSKGTINQDQIN